MNAIQYMSLNNTSSLDIKDEGQAMGKAFDIHINNARWSGEGEVMLKTGETTCLIRLLLSPRREQLGPRGTFASTAADKRCETLGQLIFMPPSSELYVEQCVGEMRALVCQLDLTRLGPLAAFRWDWGRCANDSMLNINSQYLMVSLWRLAGEILTPGFASELYMESALVGGALELRRLFIGDDEEPACQGRLSPRQLVLVRELIDADNGRELSLRALANACDLPVRRFSVSFKKTMGVTLRQYVAEARIKKAKRLLSNNSLLIKQVAVESGFSSAAAFSAAFHKAVGMTPENFRISKFAKYPLRLAAGANPYQESERNDLSSQSVF